ncbi:MAG: glycerophosphodiester phosphodiesterase [Proteobacteria bacterium]|nr:glycerophosphodiester phosphodiesterase [Pseudomonadota bacterium]
MVQIFGHRGQRRRRGVDENSLPAFAAALNDADGVETDASASADKTVHLVHDITPRYIPHVFWRSVYELRARLNKAAAHLAGTRRIDQLSDNDIDQLRLKKGGKLPKLSELFALAAKHPGKTIDIELKGDNSVQYVLDEINRAESAGHIKKEQIILTSFNHAAIEEARRREPAIKCGLIFSDVDAEIYPWSGDKTKRYVALTEETLNSQRVKSIKPEFFVMSARHVTEKNIARIHRLFPQAKIMFWTSLEKHPKKNHRLLKMLANPNIAPHIEAIITDFPGQMAAALKKKGFRP